MSKRLLGFMLGMAASFGDLYQNLSITNYHNNKPYPPLRGKTNVLKAKRLAKKRRNKKR